MRALAIVLILLLAGCSSPDSSPDTTTDEPIVANPLGPLPDPVSITDSGDMLNGVGKEWDWALDPRVKVFDVTVDVEGIYGAPLTVMNGVKVMLFQNGSLVDVGGSDAVSINGGTSTATNVFTYSVRATNSTLADQAGTWAVRIEAGNNAASYAVNVNAVYKV